VAKTIVVLPNRYFDSVFLMRVARRIAAAPGVRDASALLATEANRALLAGMGYGAGDAAFAAAGPGDLVLALEGEPEAVAAAARDPERWLARDGAAGPGSGLGSGARPRSVGDAAAQRPDASVAVISVPGAHAAREARAALQTGLHVFLFSSNVPVEVERELKLEARARGLLVMGPDCGTAFLSGAGIGFANAVRRGPVGIVGSTGTGMQELACLLDRAGAGISHGIGTGSHDLSDAIGGISTLAALDALEADPATEVIAVVSKPPGPATAAQLAARLARCAKPSVLCLLGEPADAGRAGTLDDAAARALAALGRPVPDLLRADEAALRSGAAAEVAKLGPAQRHVRGLFAGGTLCYQAQAIFRDAGLAISSNAPLRGVRALPDPWRSEGDSLVDLGAELFVEGRPHPMIDGALRRRRLEEEGADPAVGIVLLDFLLGAISSRDPVGEFLPAIRAGQEAARRRGGHLCVAASVCGTGADAQGLAAQTRALEDAGVRVLPSAAQAARFCAEARRVLGEGA
jgi:succinyl-CoA synthetase alpha subunit